MATVQIRPTGCSVIALLAILILGVSHVEALGQEVVAEPVAPMRVLFSQAKHKDADPVQRKVASRLRSVLANLEARGITRANARTRNASALSSPLAKVDRDARLQVYFHLSALGETQLLRLRRLEAEIEIANEELGIVQAWIPFDRIEAAAALPFVERITTPNYATIRSGSVNTEGDGILLADQLRDLGIDGSSVKVGVISSGVFGRSAAQASGDLPAGITEFGSCDSANWGSVLCAEGTAMLEIVHDIAPGAELGFGAVSTDLEFILRVDQLVNTFGANVVVDDLGFFDQPYFEDGSVAQAVQAVTGQAVYVSAAGNDAEGHYEANYLNMTFGGSAPILSNNVHNFGRANGGFSNDSSINVTFNPGGILIFFLQWNDPFGGSANDYDLYLLDAAESVIFAESLGFQSGFDDPIEAIGVQWTGSTPINAKIVVNRFSGVNRRLEMLLVALDTVIQQYNVPAGSVLGHPAVPGAVAVAAIDASDPGNNTIEPYSSRGPSDIYFPSFQSRPKPDITGIDGVSITGANSFPNPFFGTSAAAPHVAGIAALLRDAAPEASPAEVIAALKAGAVDLGAAGQDSVFGAGRADALAAAEQFGFPLAVLSDFSAERRSDILWRNIATGKAAIWLMNGFDKDDSGPIGAPSADWEVAGVGDFNGDKTADVLWRNTVTGKAVIWLMNGLARGASGPIGAPNTNWQVVGIGDFDGDRKADILWRNTVSGDTVIWLMDGLARDTKGSIGNPGVLWQVVGVGDFNKDTKADIVWHNGTTGNTVVWLMNGLVKEPGVSIGSPNTVWEVKGLGDFNGDRWTDLLWRKSTTGDTVIWQMSGLARDVTGSIGNPGVAWEIRGTGDHDGDVKSDLLWRNTGTGNTVIWKMDGLSKDSTGSIGDPGADWRVQ